MWNLKKKVIVHCKFPPEMVSEIHLFYKRKKNDEAIQNCHFAMLENGQPSSS